MIASATVLALGMFLGNAPPQTPTGDLTKQQTLGVSPEIIERRRAVQSPVKIPNTLVQSGPSAFESEAVRMTMAEEIGTEKANTTNLELRTGKLELYREKTDRPDIDDLQVTRRDIRLFFVFIFGAGSTLLTLFNRNIRRWIWRSAMSRLRAELIRFPPSAKP